MHHLTTAQNLKRVRGCHTEQDEQTPSERQPPNSLVYGHRQPKLLVEVLLREGLILTQGDIELAVIHEKGILAGQGVVEDRVEGVLDEGG